MRISEIYQSIQGESSFAGLPCIFIRTTGCDLRCSWCDTEFSFTGGQSMTVDEILCAIAPYPCKLVELTGGEPLLQPDLPALAQQLLAQNYTVLIETGGHRDISVLDPQVIKILDLKCPGSGETDRILWANLAHLSPQDEIKFVLLDRADYDWAKQIIAAHQLATRCKLLFSPVHGQLLPQELAAWMLQDGVTARLQLQLHKYIWSPDARQV
jgi:7-carboxy-7-deazaguanine synthase